MTREEIINLMPCAPGTNWEDADVGDVLLVIHTLNDGEIPDFNWAVTRVDKKNSVGPEGLWGWHITEEMDEKDYIDFDASYKEAYWNITRMAIQHQLPIEITTLVMECLRKL